MDNLTIAVKKYNSIRVMLIIVLSLMMAMLLGQGIKNSPITNVINVPAASSSKPVPTTQPSAANNVSSLDKALKTMAATAESKNQGGNSPASTGSNVASAGAGGISVAQSKSSNPSPVGK